MPRRRDLDSSEPDSVPQQVDELPDTPRVVAAPALDQRQSFLAYCKAKGLSTAMQHPLRILVHNDMRPRTFAAWDELMALLNKQTSV